MDSARPPLRPLSRTSGSIPEDRYRHDLALHDRFQSFGGELLRIASLGLAAYGFVLASENSNRTIAANVLSEFTTLKVIVALSPVCFGTSIAFSLVHRFLASDGMFHHLRAIKLIDLKNPELTEKIVQEEETRNDKFRRSEISLHRAAWSLGLGAALLAVAFVWIVLNFK